MRLIYCVGTATEVGKTYVGAEVLRELRDRGRAVAACKPVQSFDGEDEGAVLDAEVLGRAAGQSDDVVCAPSRTYEVAMAPPMAAEVLGRTCPTIEEMAKECLASGWDLLWVEGVGGPRSPIASDGDGVDLCRALSPDLVVLVADAGLGTINAVQLSLPPFRDLGHEPIVILNRYDDGDDLHRRNRAWLADRLGLDVVVEPSAVADRI